MRRRLLLSLLLLSSSVVLAKPPRPQPPPKPAPADCSPARRAVCVRLHHQCVSGAREACKWAGRCFTELERDCPADRSKPHEMS
jgi:hypothetical protein